VKRLLLAGLITIVCCGSIVAQTPDATTALERGVCAFKNKDYRLAESEFESALQQDPTNKMLMLFTARAIDFQVEPKDTSAANFARARSAIDAYSKLLAADPTDAEPPQAIVRLYEQIDAGRLAEIAANEATPKQVRTGIYVKLAAAQNTCANDITDENKTEVTQGRSRVYRYHTPKNPADLATAKACASEGLKLIDKALALDTHNESAWSYKASLLIQSSRLAEMQQQPAEKARLDKESLAARTEFKKLADQARAAQDKADRETEERYTKQRPTELDGAAAIQKFYESGRLVRKIPIDENSIDSRGLELLIASAPDADQRTKPTAVQPPIVWKALTPPDGSFSVMLPSPYDVERTLYVGGGEGMTFMLTYLDIPPQTPGPVDLMMSGAAWGLAEGLCNFARIADTPCDVHFAKKISLASYPGLEYTVTEDNCIKVLPGLLRVYATPTRVYALAVIGGNETDPRAAKFLNSFSVKK
jgi:tetratricopeptide (TPR) repeat protein